MAIFFVHIIKSSGKKVLQIPSCWILFNIRISASFQMLNSLVPFFIKRFFILLLLLTKQKKIAFFVHAICTNVHCAVDLSLASPSIKPYNVKSNDPYLFCFCIGVSVGTSSWVRLWFHLCAWFYSFTIIVITSFTAHFYHFKGFMCKESLLLDLNGFVENFTSFPIMYTK